MPKLFRILLEITVFAVVLILSVRPSWWLMEKLWTSKEPSDCAVAPSDCDVQEHLYAVLVRRQDQGNRYAIDFYPGLDSGSSLVTDPADEDLARINRDLVASISEISNSETVRNPYPYFKVLERGQGYVDVSLEQPTQGDFWRKNAYRIQNGEVQPQRIIFFSPIFGMFVAVLSTIAGVAAVKGCDALIRRRQRKSPSLI